MNALTLIHGSIEPILYGLVIFVGLLITLNKLLNFQILSFVCDVAVAFCDEWFEDNCIIEVIEK